LVVTVEDVGPEQTWLAAPIWLAEQQIWSAAVQVEPIWLAVRQTSLEVARAEQVWLAVGQTSLEVARAELVSAQAVLPVFRRALPEQVQQPVAVDCDSAECWWRLVAALEQGERESLGQLVFRQQSA
jgi:hypothetical protein